MDRIGFSIGVGHLAGRVSRLEEDLSELVRLGCAAAEIPVLGIDPVVGGKLIKSKVELLRQVTGRFDLSYSIHAPNNLNFANPRLGNDGRPDVQREMDILAACIELTAAIGGEVLVYHCGVRNGTEDREARRREVSALKQLMPLAEKHGIMLGLENTGSGVRDLLEQMEAVAADHLRLTLDLGHLFLAAQSLGLDYLREIREAASCVCHVHHYDNHGVQGKADVYPIRIVFAESDLHLPLDWGTIPHTEALAALGDYEGLWILEVNERFRDHWPECLCAMREHLNETRLSNVKR